MHSVGLECPNNESCEESNAFHFKDKLRWGAKFSSEASDVTLPRKASSEYLTARTANRHR